MQYSFIIRRAEPEDAGAIREITRRAFEKYVKDANISSDIEALEETIEQIEADIKNKYVYIALVNEVTVGSMRININDDKTAYLTRFGVRADHSNMGIGKALMALADSLMKEFEMNKLTLHTASTYRELVRFYYGRGFYIDSTNKDKGYIRAFLVKEYN